MPKSKRGPVGRGIVMEGSTCETFKGINASPYREWFHIDRTKGLINNELRDRIRFLEHIRQAVRFWAVLPGKTQREIAEGVAFSILVALDGEAVACGPYAVRSIDEQGKEGENIAGTLHEEFVDDKE